MAVCLVGDALCILCGRAPSWDNFKGLLLSPTFIKDLTEFDQLSIPPQTLWKLQVRAAAAAASQPASQPSLALARVCACVHLSITCRLPMRHVNVTGHGAANHAGVSAGSDCAGEQGSERALHLGAPDGSGRHGLHAQASATTQLPPPEVSCCWRGDSSSSNSRRRRRSRDGGCRRSSSGVDEAEPAAKPKAAAIPPNLQPDRWPNRARRDRG